MRNLLLGEAIQTFDLGLALRGQYGTFHVICPDGGELLVTCKPGHSISNIEWAGNEDSRKPYANGFKVTKVIEPAVPSNVTEYPTGTRTAAVG
jgi:hypothetical protein